MQGNYIEQIHFDLGDLISNQFLTNLGLRTPRLQQSPLGLVWRWSLQKLLLET